VRLLALDIDGTLLDSARQLRQRTREALRAVMAQGVHVALVTGRRTPAARRIVAELDLGPLPLVLHNGALVMLDGEIVRCRPLARAVARDAVRAGHACGAGVVVHCGQRGEGLLLVQQGGSQSTLVAYYLDRAHPDVRLVPDLEAALEEDPIQVMFGGAIAEMAGLQPALVDALGARARLERTVYPARDVELIDVLAPEVGKAEALRFLQQQWRVTPAETLAIGDNWNDREMLLEAGRGLVMGNAEPGLRALGLEVLPTNDEDGVVVALERYVLAGPAGA
jgi:hypothetical protein